MQPNQMSDEMGDAPLADNKLSADELAQAFLAELSRNGYNLTDKVAVSRQVRKLLRTETEEAQKLLEGLLDSL